MSTDLRTIGHLMRDAGYYTAYKGKWHLTKEFETVNELGSPTIRSPSVRNAGPTRFRRNVWMLRRSQKLPRKRPSNSGDRDAFRRHAE